MPDKKKAKPRPKLETTEITAAYTGKISTGQWENESPFFSLKEIWSGSVEQSFVDERQKALSSMCYDKFSDCEQRSSIDRIQKNRKNIRFYHYGKELYPSVTSVINWDNDFEKGTKRVHPDDMRQYAARGTIIHILVADYLKTGTWKNPKDIIETYPYRVILKNGSLNLKTDKYNFPGFYEKYHFDTIDCEKEVYNHDYKYAGRYDIKCMMYGYVTLADIKTGNSIDKVAAFKQLAAYAKCRGNEDVKQLVIIPLNTKTEQGFSAPAVEKDMEKYWELFLDNRTNFKERYGV